MDLTKRRNFSGKSFSAQVHNNSRVRDGSLSGSNSQEVRLGEIERSVQACGELGHFEKDLGSNRIIVVFSHVDIPKGKFAQSRAVRDIPGSKLFLNCLDNQWYTNGIHEFSSDIPSTVSQVLKLIEGYEAVFVGHSMGAYLSLICGNIHKQSKFVSTSPELFLGLEGSRSVRNNVPEKPKWWNLDELRSRFHNKPDGVTLFGAYDPIDCYFLSEPERLEGLGRVYEVPHHHGVTEYMTSYKMYDRFLSDVFAGKRDEGALLAREHFAPIGTHGTPEKYSHFYETFCVFMNARNDTSTLKEKASVFADWTNPGWQELRAKIFYTAGDFANALAAAQSAYAFQPDLMQFIETYGNVCLKMKEVSKLADLIDGLKPAQKNHRIGKKLVEKVHQSFGQLYRLQLNTQSPASAEETATAEENVPASEMGNCKIEEVQPSAYPFEHYEQMPPEDTAQGAAVFHAALTSREYDYVLSGTNFVRDHTRIDHADVVMCRAFSLIQKGDASAALRTLYAAIDDAKVGRRSARICLDIGLKTRSVHLIDRYLEMDLNDRARKFHVKRLARALDFVSDPQRVIVIVLEVLKFGTDLEKRLSKLRVSCVKHGTTAAVINGLLDKVSDVSLSKCNAEALAQFMTDCGYRNSALNLLSDDTIFLEDPRDPDSKFIRGQIEGMLPTKSDLSRADQ